MTFKDIQILRVNYLRGPNIWTYRPIIEALIDLGEMEDYPSNKIDGFNDRINAWLPGLVEHHCGVGHRGGFLTRLVGGTWMGHIIEHVSIELQLLAGARAEFGKAREISRRGIYKVVFRTEHEVLGRASFAAAHRLVMCAANNLPFDLQATIEELKEIVDDLCLGPSTATIVDAAIERKTPFIRLTEGNLVQLGYGAKQRRIWTAETDRTSAIAEGISSDKDLTKRLLSQCGIPMPEGQIVHSADEAWAAAQDIGLPVVIKPADGNRGRGVSLNVNSEQAVRAAWQAANAVGAAWTRSSQVDVLVERYVLGDEHRVLVVGNRVVAATRGETATITGDGVSSVSQLIDAQINTDPRRGDNETFPLGAIRLGSPRSEMSLLEIQRQGLEPDSIVDKGRVVVVQRNGNLNIDVTDQVHPEVAEAATLASRIIGLDIAGIDVVTQDIGKPLEQTHGALIEVNAGPGLLMHVKPAVGEPRPVGKAIVDHLFGPNESGRIPVVGIVGTHQPTHLAHLVAWLLHLSGQRTGLACQDGLYMDQFHQTKQDARNFENAERLLINRSLDAAVIETSAHHILNEGLAYDRCQVGVVTNMPETDDELIQAHDIIDAEKMRTVIRTQIDLVLPTGAAVLNAEDEAVVSLAELSDGEVIYFALNKSNATLQAHLQAGGRAVYLDQNEVVLHRGQQENRLFNLDLELIAQLLKQGFETRTLVTAVACAWALDINPPLIRAGLKNFGQQQVAAKDLARMNG